MQAISKEITSLDFWITDIFKQYTYIIYVHKSYVAVYVNVWQMDKQTNGPTENATRSFRCPT